MSGMLALMPNRPITHTAKIQKFLLRIAAGPGSNGCSPNFNSIKPRAAWLCLTLAIERLQPCSICRIKNFWIDHAARHLYLKCSS